MWDSNRDRFEKIIVVNDRKILDEQLGDTVASFLEQHGIHDIERAKTSAQLARLRTAILILAHSHSSISSASLCMSLPSVHPFIYRILESASPKVLGISMV